MKYTKADLAHRTARIMPPLFYNSDGGPTVKIGLFNAHGQVLSEGDILSPTKKLGKNWLKGEQEIAVISYYPQKARYLLNFYTAWGGEGYSGDQTGQQIWNYREWYVIGNVFAEHSVLGIKR